MTTKEMLNAVINGNITDEVKKKAQEMLNKAEEKTGKRAEQSAKNRTENIAIAEVIYEKMESRIYGASEIVPLISDVYPDIKTAKVVAVMAVGIDEGMFTKVEDYKVGGKGRKVNGYTKIEPTETEGENETEVKTGNED